MIGIGQVERQIDFLTGMQGLLKDRLEIGLDRVGQRLDRAIARFLPFRRACRERALGLFENLAQPGDLAGVDVWDGGQFLDVGQQRLDSIADTRRLARTLGLDLALNVERLEPDAGDAVDHVGCRRQRGRASLVQRLVASAIVSGGLREPGPDEHRLMAGAL